MAIGVVILYADIWWPSDIEALNSTLKTTDLKQIDDWFSGLFKSQHRSLFTGGFFRVTLVLC